MSNQELRMGRMIQTKTISLYNQVVSPGVKGSIVAMPNATSPNIYHVLLDGWTTPLAVHWREIELLGEEADNLVWRLVPKEKS